MEALALLIAASLHAGTILALAGLGLLINERAGVLNLGLMLSGSQACLICRISDTASAPNSSWSSSIL